MTETTPLEALLSRLKEIGGCSDGNCRIIRPKGMHTNGGCRCLREDKYRAERVLGAYRDYVHAIEGKDKAYEAGI